LIEALLSMPFIFSRKEGEGRRLRDKKTMPRSSLGHERKGKSVGFVNPATSLRKRTIPKRREKGLLLGFTFMRRRGKRGGRGEALKSETVDLPGGGGGGNWRKRERRKVNGPAPYHLA